MSEKIYYLCERVDDDSGGTEYIPVLRPGAPECQPCNKDGLTEGQVVELVHDVAEHIEEGKHTESCVLERLRAHFPATFAKPEPFGWEFDDGKQPRKPEKGEWFLPQPTTLDNPGQSSKKPARCTVEGYAHSNRYIVRKVDHG